MSGSHKRTVVSFVVVVVGDDELCNNLDFVVTDVVEVDFAADIGDGANDNFFVCCIMGEYSPVLFSIIRPNERRPPLDEAGKAGLLGNFGLRVLCGGVSCEEHL